MNLPYSITQSHVEEISLLFIMQKLFAQSYFLPYKHIKA